MSHDLRDSYVTPAGRQIPPDRLLELFAAMSAELLLLLRLGGGETIWQV